MLNNLNKISVILIILSILLFSFSGCKSTEKTAEQSISCRLVSEPKAIDPAFCTSSGEADVVLACFEGLMRLDKDNKAIPGIAASYVKKSDTDYVFKLREAKWSDGRDVCAKDFEYAWKRALCPETGCENAYQLYCIKGGEAYNRGTMSPDKVGVKAVDDKTLEVNLETPVSNFPSLLAYPVYMPLREDVILSQAGIWTEDPSSYIGNGPFKLVSWDPGDTIGFVKNPGYYDSSRVKLENLTFRVIDNPEACVEAFEKGSIDMIESPPSDEISSLAKRGVLTQNPYIGVYYYSFNTRKKPLNDKRVRKAMAYAIDRHELIQDIIGSEAVPAVALVPKGIPEASDICKDFRDAGGAYLDQEGQLEEARKLLKEAGYPGGKGFPKITLTYNDLGYHREIAQAVQDMWKNNLGIKVDLEAKDWKGLQKVGNSGTFDIIRQGWVSDYADPMTFLELFASSCSNNIPGYEDKAYDNLISSARYETDYAKKFSMLHQAEGILMEDMPVLPVYFYTNLVCSKPYVKGVVKLPMGFTYFDQAYVNDKK